MRPESSLCVCNGTLSTRTVKKNAEWVRRKYMVTLRLNEWPPLRSTNIRLVDLGVRANIHTSRNRFRVLNNSIVSFDAEAFLRVLHYHRIWPLGECENKLLRNTLFTKQRPQLLPSHATRRLRIVLVIFQALISGANRSSENRNCVNPSELIRAAEGEIVQFTPPAKLCSKQIQVLASSSLDPEQTKNILHQLP